MSSSRPDVARAPDVAAGADGRYDTAVVLHDRARGPAESRADDIVPSSERSGVASWPPRAARLADDHHPRCGCRPTRRLGGRAPEPGELRRRGHPRLLATRGGPRHVVRGDRRRAVRARAAKAAGLPGLAGGRAGDRGRRGGSGAPPDALRCRERRAHLRPRATGRRTEAGGRCRVVAGARPAPRGRIEHPPHRDPLLAGGAVGGARRVESAPGSEREPAVVGRRGRDAGDRDADSPDIPVSSAPRVPDCGGRRPTRDRRNTSACGRAGARNLLRGPGRRVDRPQRDGERRRHDEHDPGREPGDVSGTRRPPGRAEHTGRRVAVETRRHRRRPPASRRQPRPTRQASGTDRDRGHPRRACRLRDLRGEGAASNPIRSGRLPHPGAHARATRRTPIGDGADRPLRRVGGRGFATDDGRPRAVGETKGLACARTRRGTALVSAGGGFRARGLFPVPPADAAVHADRVLLRPGRRRRLERKAPARRSRRGSRRGSRPGRP
jgi:hypothetical protein